MALKHSMIPLQSEVWTCLCAGETPLVILDHITRFMVGAMPLLPPKRMHRENTPEEAEADKKAIDSLMKD